MITYENMIESILIFQKYATPDDDCLPLSPMHDQLYAGPDPEIVSEEDKERLKSFGWFEDSDSFCIFT